MTFEQAISRHYGGEMTASCPISPAVLARVNAARAQAICAGCQQPISVNIEARVVGISWYHPSCGAKAAARSAAITAAPTAPVIIGRLHGAAVPLNTPCFVEAVGGVEQFTADAFARALAAPQTVTLRIGHRGTDVPGSMKLAIEDHALQFVFDVFDSIEGRASLDRAKRDAFAGCSISFSHESGARTWDTANREIWRDVRLKHIALIERGGTPAWYSTWVRSV